MRERSTWHNGGERQAATSRRADVYTMNQEHKQPSLTEYVNGDPDAWAETPVSAEKSPVNDEYEGGKVKRNEVGLGEFRSDTWKHKDSEEWNGKGKYDNAKLAAERKATAAERVARAMLRTQNTDLVAGAALDLMSLPNARLASLLKHLDSVSIDRLPEDAKLRRAYACTKLAARTLGTDDEAAVERLASLFMKVEDSTLKNMLKVVASARVAQDEGDEQEGEKEDEKTASGKEEGEKEEKPEAQQAAKEEEGGKDEPMEAQAQGLSSEEQKMLQSMLHECAPAPAAPVPAPAAPAAPVDELQSLFEVPAAPAAPAAPVVQAAPAASYASDISFDDDDSEVDASVNVASIEDLFADDPEVQAQRSIQAAAQEQRAREGGFAAVGRTASAGARKLGAVRPEKASSVDQALEMLWDRT